MDTIFYDYNLDENFSIRKNTLIPYEIGYEQREKIPFCITFMIFMKGCEPYKLLNESALCNSSRFEHLFYRDAEMRIRSYKVMDRTCIMI